MLVLEDPRNGDGRLRCAADGREGRREVLEGGPELSYRDLVERVPAVLYVDASDGPSSAIYVSPQTDAMLGYSRGEWLEDPELWVKMLHPDDRGRVLDEHDHARRVGGPFEAEYRLISRDGSVVWVRDEAALVCGENGGPGKRTGVLLDITERKLYEEKLRKSEERFRLVARATGEAIWDNDLTTGVQAWDGATEALFGYSPRRATTGAWWEERVHPDDRERVLSGLAAVTGGDGDLWEEEYRFRRADGTHARVLDRGYVVRDASGRPVRMVGSMRDVDEKRRHQEELRRSEELFRTTFEAAAVGMAHVAPDGRWLRINGRLCEILGYPREELLGMTFLGMTPPGDRASGAERVRRLLAGEIGPYSVERRYVKKDGSRVWMNLTVSLVRKESSGEPDHFVCVAEDITERKIEELVPDPLTPREMEVLQRIVAGQRNGEIANQLHRSLGAVKHQVQQVLAKLGVENRNRAAVRAIEMGLVRPR